jgi:hypothetical protein
VEAPFFCMPLDTKYRLQDGPYLQLGERVVMLVESGLGTAVQHRVVDLAVHPAYHTEAHKVSRFVKD